MFNIHPTSTPTPFGYSQAVDKKQSFLNVGFANGPEGVNKRASELIHNNGKKFANFALYSSVAEAVDLCLFANGEEHRFPMQRTENVWHLAVENVEVGTEYGFRLTGKNLNPQKLMLDPYAKAVRCANGEKPDLSTIEARSWFLMNDDRDNAHLAPRAVVISDEFDWENDRTLNTPWAQTIIYELHVKGFSQLNEQIPAHLRGTYQGLAHPVNLAYLKELGITAVELLPVNFHLNEPHLQEKGLQNYWGYNPLAMFAVEPKYAATDNPLAEFKGMVKAFHAAGIEVILDVVFNHSAESEQHFPTFSQRGIDDKAYYWYQNGYYLNATGCGNTLNLASEAGRKWTLDCLKYWVEECHIDGFRFDLATVLGREPDYNLQAQLFAEIKNEPSLQNVKLIAEPWDVGHYGYQVGNFPSYFAEWNDRFRDDLCRFWLWKSGEVGAFAERLAGSSDLFKKNDRLPHASINFITAHDGFTLRDLASYNHKHNEANGEQNRDGRNENYSYNFGVEGDQFDSLEQKNVVKTDRTLVQQALLASLLLANGTPMLLAGSEFGNTQFGNNNAYCQDNEITWLKWTDFDENLFELVKQTIALRKQIACLNNDQWWSAENVEWLNIFGEPMNLENWHDRATKAMQVRLNSHTLLLINAKTEPQQFTLPRLPQGSWNAVVENPILALEPQFAYVGSQAVCVLACNPF